MKQMLTKQPQIIKKYYENKAKKHGLLKNLMLLNS